MLKIREKDRILFSDCKIHVSDVLEPNLKYKLCFRFDGGLELVETDKKYWIEDGVKFN